MAQNMHVRQSWLSAVTLQLIPDADEGLILEIANWESPLLRACSPLGIDGQTGRGGVDGVEGVTARPLASPARGVGWMG